MKAKHVIIYLLLVIVTSSCIRDEAPNAEADILSCRLPGITMTTSPIINNNSVTLFVTPGTNISALAPEFTLTSGATITPASGTERNFNSPQEYQVTAADGIWKKTYAISVIDTELATIYNFEDTISGKKYYIFVERENDKVIMEWASGNAGYAMTGVAKTADDYPTFQIANGKNGKCLSLVTRSTGFFGGLVGMPIAAGNLFIGSFDVNNAMSNPLQATKFGLPFRCRFSPLPRCRGDHHRGYAHAGTCRLIWQVTINTRRETSSPKAANLSKGNMIYAIYMLSCTKRAYPSPLSMGRMHSLVLTWFLWHVSKTPRKQTNGLTLNSRSQPFRENSSTRRN